MVGGGPFRLKPGQWTDDTSMPLCLATSLLECLGFDADIQDSDLRTECRALLYQEPSVCDGVTDITERRLCRSKLENKAH